MPDDPSYDIKVLIAKVAEGDEVAFRTIFDRYKIRFHSAAYKMTRSADAAEEIVQEVFINLWNNRKQVAASDNPENYIKRILYNSVFAHFRKLLVEKKLRRSVLQTLESQENIIEERLFMKENSFVLHTLINQLPAQQKLVYKLSKQEGLTREEIASRLNISPNTVRNHLSAAVESISSELKKGTSIFIWIAIYQALCLF